MRLENLFLSGLCAAGVAVAVAIAWRGRHLPLVGARPTVLRSATDAVQDALRSVATVLSAGLIAGFLAVGLGGRLVMRLLAATSGDRAQGRLTEADETVGEITLGGSVGFVVFVGLLVPVAVSLVYLVARRLLPGPVWIGGSIFGLLLLATLGVDDPLSSDNVDFEILSPRPLTITLIAATALLFGVTFAAVAAQLDRTMRPIADPGWSGKAGYLSLVVLASPLFVAAAVYVGGRAIARGRIGALLDERLVRLAGRVVVVIAAAGAVAVVIRTATQIL